MTRRYIYAILAGTAVGLFALTSVSFCPVILDCWGDERLVLTRMQPIPLWDFHLFSSSGECSFDLSRRSYDPGFAHSLHYRAIFLRFCMLFLQDGFYYFAIPVGLACLMTKLNECDDPHSILVCIRRSVKLTGLILLGIYLVFAPSSAIGSRSFEEWILKMISLFWDGLIMAIFYGFAETLFLFSFLTHLIKAAYGKRMNAKVQSEIADELQLGP